MSEYLYGVTATHEEKDFGLVGIGGEEDKVYTVPYRDISALVSSSPPLVYDSIPKETLVRYLAVHQAVIEGVMKKTYTVVPMKFGTTVRDKEEIKEILASGYSQLRDVLEQMDNKIELEVVALWSNLDSILKEIGKEERIRKFKERMAAKASSSNFLAARLELGKIVKSLLDERRGKLGREIIGELKKGAIDFRKHEILDDTMIMNTAFLVNKHQAEDLNGAVEHLNQKYEEKVNFRIVGPLPPYSFTTLTLERTKWGKIVKAMKTLEVGEEATLDEVKRTYRNLTRRFHPDRNPQAPGAQKQFEAISQAYHLLVNYCSRSKSSWRKGKNKDFITVRITETPRVF